MSSQKSKIERWKLKIENPKYPKTAFKFRHCFAPFWHRFAKFRNVLRAQKHTGPGRVPGRLRAVCTWQKRRRRRHEKATLGCNELNFIILKSDYCYFPFLSQFWVSHVPRRAPFVSGPARPIQENHSVVFENRRHHVVLKSSPQLLAVAV